MHRPAPLTRRALASAVATPSSNPAVGTRSRRGAMWPAALALVALSVTAFTGASAEASTGKLAERLRRLDPGALVGGESIVGTRPGQQLRGVHGRPNFIAALGDGETIHGASINDELGAGPHARDVKIIAPVRGHSLIVAGAGGRVVASGKGHNLIYSHAAGATIVLESPANEVIADGPHDKIVCASHSSHELIEITRGVKVSKSCKGHHNQIEPAPAASPSASSSAASAHASSATVLGSGTNADPYMPDRCDEGDDPTWDTGWGCTATFPARTLTGFWANEAVPSYACPRGTWLKAHYYAPFGTSLPKGVEVDGLGDIGVSITGVYHYAIPETGYLLANQTATGGGYSSATNWTADSASYTVILHCTSDPWFGYDS
jgi:hypothetical protein